MSKVLKRDPRIKQFCDLINQGIEAWIDAGKLLCGIVADNSDAYTQILDDNPHLTYDILETFERIGKREIYPYLIVDGSPGSRKLVALPYDMQVKLYNGSVNVVSKRVSGMETRRKKVCNLSASEAALVFDVTRVRTPDEQMKILRAKDRVPTGNGKRFTLPQDREVDVSEETREASPAGVVAGHLDVAQNALLQVRSELPSVSTNRLLDDHITRALTEIGKLRIAVLES